MTDSCFVNDESIENLLIEMLFSLKAFLGSFSVFWYLWKRMSEVISESVVYQYAQEKNIIWVPISTGCLF